MCCKLSQGKLSSYEELLLILIIRAREPGVRCRLTKRGGTGSILPIRTIKIHGNNISSVNNSKGLTNNK